MTLQPAFAAALGAPLPHAAAQRGKHNDPALQSEPPIHRQHLPKAPNSKQLRPRQSDLEETISALAKAESAHRRHAATRLTTCACVSSALCRVR
eukprot:3510462-Amphidinium_carterae.1